MAEKEVWHTCATSYGLIWLRKGFPNISRLFEAISYAKRVHASNHFNEIGGDTSDTAVTGGGVFGIGKTVENAARSHQWRTS